MIENQPEAARSPETDPSAYQFRLRDFPLGAQMLFIAFGALVLVPILTGLDPKSATLTARPTGCFSSILPLAVRHSAGDSGPLQMPYAALIACLEATVHKQKNVGTTWILEANSCRLRHILNQLQIPKIAQKNDEIFQAGVYK